MIIIISKSNPKKSYVSYCDVLYKLDKDKKSMKQNTITGLCAFLVKQKMLGMPMSSLKIAKATRTYNFDSSLVLD